VMALQQVLTVMVLFKEGFVLPLACTLQLLRLGLENATLGDWPVCRDRCWRRLLRQCSKISVTLFFVAAELGAPAPCSCRQQKAPLEAAHAPQSSLELSRAASTRRRNVHSSNDGIIA
jgi:hypothetical protein